MPGTAERHLGGEATRRRARDGLMETGTLPAEVRKLGGAGAHRQTLLQRRRSLQEGPSAALLGLRRTLRADRGDATIARQRENSDRTKPTHLLAGGGGFCVACLNYSMRAGR